MSYMSHVSRMIGRYSGNNCNQVPWIFWVGFWPLKQMMLLRPGRGWPRRKARNWSALWSPQLTWEDTMLTPRIVAGPRKMPGKLHIQLWILMVRSLATPNFNWSLLKTSGPLLILRFFQPQPCPLHSVRIPSCWTLSVLNHKKSVKLC